jgi:squalene-associated FAD-dependent desaturase
VTSRVTVVGGGLAGMAAALRLADGGTDVVLVERRSRLGGLTSSFQRNGLWFDNGQHVFLRCCTEYRAFLDRIDAAELFHLQDRLDVPVLAPGGPTSRLARAPLPAPLHLGPSLARYRHLRPLERAAAVRAALALRRLDPDDPALDAVTFGAWLADHGQSPNAVAHLWQLIARPTLNLTVDEAALGPAVKVFRTGLLDRADAADIGWARAPLGEAHGGRGQAALQRAGVELVAGAAVDGLDVGDEVCVRLPGRTIAADAVVLATSHDVATALLPPDALATGVDPSRLGTSPVIDVHLVLDRRVTDLPFAAVVDSPVQFVFDRTESSGATSGQVLAVSLSAAEGDLATRPEVLVEQMVNALGDVLPAVRGATVLDGHVTKERAATFRAVPGSAAHRRASRTRLPGVYLAGAWTATGWPATMEGAVRSGHAAATAITADRAATASRKGAVA